MTLSLSLSHVTSLLYSCSLFRLFLFLIPSFPSFPLSLSILFPSVSYPSIPLPCFYPSLLLCTILSSAISSFIMYPSMYFFSPCVLLLRFFPPAFLSFSYSLSPLIPFCSFILPFRFSIPSFPFLPSAISSSFRPSVFIPSSFCPSLLLLSFLPTLLLFSFLSTLLSFFYISSSSYLSSFILFFFLLIPSSSFSTLLPSSSHSSSSSRPPPVLLLSSCRSFSSRPPPALVTLCLISGPVVPSFKYFSGV